MRAAWNGLKHGPAIPAIVVSAVVVLAAVRFAPVRKHFDGVAYGTGVAELPAEPLVNVPIGASKGASAHHLRVSDEVKPHLHRRHDETVVVLSGRGTVVLGSATVDVEPGSVLIVPRGMVHSLVVSGTPLEAVSVFSPPFDGQDRVFVDE